MRNILILLVLTLGGCSIQQTTDPKAKQDAQLYYKRALSEIRAGEQVKALQSVKQAVEIDPQNAQAQELNALINQQNGQLDEAANSFQIALSLSPDSPSLLNNYGNFQCQRKNYRSASALFEKAANLVKNSQPEIAYTNAGLCAVRAGDAQNAESYLKQAIEIRPDQAVSLYQLGQLALAANRPLAANSWLKQYLRHYPHNAKTLLQGAIIEKQLDNPLGLKDYADKLRSGFPSASETIKAELMLSKLGESTTVSRSGFKPVGSNLFGSDWVAGRNPDYFTVQIASSNNRQELEQLATRLSESTNAIYLINTGGAEPRYNLISGDYEIFQTAQTSMQRAKIEVSAQNPWIRNFASIQANSLQ